MTVYIKLILGYNIYILYFYRIDYKDDRSMIFLCRDDIRYKN